MLICRASEARASIVLDIDEKKVCLKGWFTRHQICRQDLLVK